MSPRIEGVLVAITAVVWVGIIIHMTWTLT